MLYDLIPNHPTLSLMTWGVLGLLLFYLGRTPVHALIRAIFTSAYFGFRMVSRSLLHMADRMAKRNREVLIESGRDAAERRLDREFLRLDSAVKRDLGNYPALHREVQEKMQQLETDYRASTEEQPPNVEGWEKAISAVARIPSKGSTIVADVLEDINNSFNNTHKAMMKDYRNTNKQRHKTLARLIPTVRSMNRSMEQVDRNLRDLTDRAHEVGKYMDEFKEMRSKSERAEYRLAASTLFQFFISGIVLAIALMGAVINFYLIEPPMGQMVGSNQYIKGVPVSEIGAMVIIMVEISMGLFLMELLRITRLFPGIGSLDDVSRKRLIWIAFTILTILAFVELALGSMRDQIFRDDAGTKAALSGTGTVVATGVAGIPAIGQMILGFILPYALMFIAIPLEYFLHAALTALRTLVVVLIRFIAFALRLVGNLFRHMGIIIVKTYDLIIIVPLWLETKLVSKEKATLRGKGKLGVHS